MLPLAHTRREAFNTEVEPFVQCFTNYIFEIRSLEVEFQSEINRHLCAGSTQEETVIWRCLPDFRIVEFSSP
jgi:hypothetical protein